jgi:hypothetical protein
MQGHRVGSFLVLIILGAVISNAIGRIAFPINERLCIAWSADSGVCTIANGVQSLIAMNAHIVPVLVSGFLFFLGGCRIARRNQALMPAVGIVLYSAISWSMAQYWEFTGVTPQEALAVVFSGACALLYFHWRPASPNKTMEPTR